MNQRLPSLGAGVCGRARTAATLGVVSRWRDWHISDGCDHVVWISASDPYPATGPADTTA
jgi:hypothetical protein